MSLILGPIHGIFLLFGLALLALKVWALVDACVQPERAYYVAGKWSKVGWVVVLALGCFAYGLGIFGLAALVAAIVYLVDVRPALREVRGPH